MRKKQRYFKGFDSELKCRDKQYKVGDIFTAADTTKEAEIGRSSSIHFCKTLKDTFSYYGPAGGCYRRDEARYCVVQPLAGHQVVEASNILGSRHLEILKEIPKEVVARYRRFCEHWRKRKQILDNHKLDLIRLLQTRYPELILCGSAAVFLHTGKVYARNTASAIHDLDFVVPYYIKIEGDDPDTLGKVYEKLNDEDFGFDEEGNETAKEGALKVSKTDKWGSGNDFDECVYVNNVPCDIAVNPHNKYEYIKFRGFKYKVASLPSILEAKLKYANQGSGKHMQDIMDLINLPKTFNV